MRVLQLGDMYPPNLGGTEQHIETLSRWLASNGHEVGVVAMHRMDLPPTSTDDLGVTVHRLKGWSSHLQRFLADPKQTYHPTMPDPGLDRRIAKICETFRPDVVHAHGWIGYSTLGVRRSQERTKTIRALTLHDNSIQCVRKILTTPDNRPCPGRSLKNCGACAIATYGAVRGPIYAAGNFASKNILAGYDQIVAVSRFVKEQSDPLARACGRPDVEVIPSFIRPEVAALASAERSTRPDFLPAGRFVLYVGVIADHKGIAPLLEAWHGITTDASLVLIGPDRRTNKTPFPAGAVHVGSKPNMDVLAAWPHAAAGVIPSTCPDSLPTVTSEAMAFGVPVVASNIGGLPDQITNDDNGLLVPPGDVLALRAAMQRLLHDPILAARLASRGRVTVKNFHVDVVGPKLIDCFERALARLR